MKNYIIGLVGIALGATGATFGAVNINPNSLILADNIEQHSRLKQPPVWDTSVISSKEMTQAYIDVAKKYDISAKDIVDAGGNIQLAIQRKMAGLLLLCDNANTNKL